LALLAAGFGFVGGVATQRAALRVQSEQTASTVALLVLHLQHNCCSAGAIGADGSSFAPNQFVVSNYLLHRRRCRHDADSATLTAPILTMALPTMAHVTKLTCQRRR